MYKLIRLSPALYAAACVLLAASSATGSEVRLMDTSSILRNYGFANGRFDIYEAMAITPEMDSRVRTSFGAIEGKANIDSAEEFISAAYYSSIQISTRAQSAIKKELPQGKEGALRLASMWLRKRAEHPENRSGYMSALNIIMNRSRISMNEITDYYAASIEKEIVAKGKRRLGDRYSERELKNTVLRPIINYYVNPTDENLKNISRFGHNFRYEMDFYLTLGDLNQNVRIKAEGMRL